MGSVLTTLTFALHVLSGLTALAAGGLALCVRKGGRLHRAVGDLFVVAMIFMASSAAVLGVIRPGQIINVFISAFTLYLVATAWLAGRRGTGAAGAPEMIALAVSLVLCAPFAIMLFQAFSGVNVFATAFPLRGPILIALCVFSSIIFVAAIGDARALLSRGLVGTPRVARHLWRMCVGLAMALGSAFSNGFARLLPGPYHVPPAFFAPPFLMLAVLLYWIIRIRFPGWAGKQPAKAPSSLVGTAL